MSPRTVIADILILGALGLIFYIYYPIILSYTPLQTNPILSEYSIEIPKINAAAPIIANVDPWNKEAYEEPLKQGVAQAQGFADVGQKGTVYMFAHSSLPPWEITRTNTAFLRLHELEIGDEIIINKFGQTYTYKVKEKKEVWPEAVENIKTDTASQLILQTCTPLGTDLKRLLVYAVPVE